MPEENVMFQIRPQADTLPETFDFNAVWHKAVKSGRLGQRRRLIKRLRADTRYRAANISIWLGIHGLPKLVLLKLLEWEMRPQKPAARTSFAAKAMTHMNANGSANDHVR
jgi:hypothetical protein